MPLIILNTPFSAKQGIDFLNGLSPTPLYLFEYPTYIEDKSASLHRVDIQYRQSEKQLTIISLFENQSLRRLRRFLDDWQDSILGHVVVIHDLKYQLSEADSELFSLTEGNSQDSDDEIWANVSITYGKDRIKEVEHHTPQLPYAVLVERREKEKNLTIDEIRHLMQLDMNVMVDKCDLQDKNSIKQFLLRFLHSLDQDQIVKDTIALVVAL